MKFGQKQTVSQKARMVEDRYGKTMGASKGTKPLPKAKVKPTGNPFKGKVGIKVTKKI